MNARRPFSKENIRTFLLLIIPLTLPLVPAVVNNRIIAVSTLLVFVSAFIHGDLKHFRIPKANLLLMGFFLLQLLGLTYSRNVSHGWKDIETLLPLIAFPLLLGSISNSIDEQKIRVCLYALVAGVLLTCTICTALLLINWNGEELFQYFAENGHVRFSTFVHPTYLGIYTSFSILFLLNDLIEREPHRKTRLFLTASLCLFLILINAKTAILAFVVLTAYFCFLRLRTPRLRIYFLAFIVFFLSLMIVYAPTRERFIEAPLKVLQMKGAVDAFDQPTWSYSFRLQIYTCAIDRIFLSPIIGYGTGSSNQALMNCYQQKEFPWMISRKFNAHNQYLEAWLQQGLFGLAALLLLFLTPLRAALKSQCHLVTIFLLLIMISALTENILSVQKGVNFFAFFYSIFAFRLYRGIS